jgi:WD40 repeat protein/class 3 adenylate cyclase
MSDRLGFFTLGGVRIERNGELVTGLTSKKAEALLIYLASTQRPQSREVLAELVRDECTQSQAVDNLSDVLTNLQQVLGEYIVITRKAAGLNPEADVWLDATDLENRIVEIHRSGRLNDTSAKQLATALDLYQGEFLQGFTMSDCLGFEDWSTRERQRIRQLAIDGYSALVIYFLEQKGYTQGIIFARRLLELDPLMESTHRYLIQLLEASGQHTAALAQFETCQKLLRDELGAEPEAETRRLYDQIRTGSPVTKVLPPALPRETVTFLFTDIEGSTQLLGRLRDKYAILLDDHRRLLRKAFAHWEGHEVDTQGDAFFVAFGRATQAVGAAAEAQKKLSEHIWPERENVRVRMGIHTGETWTNAEGYMGMEVHRAARIAHVASGGQVLLSETTAALVRDELPPRVTLLDLGRHLLKDIHRPEHIQQMVIEGLRSEFPPLASLEALPPEAARPPRKVGICPYRGLAAFRESDAQFYFGREAFIDALEQTIKSKKFVAVILGSSGSGKSSALSAGLLPRLRSTGRYQVAILRPGTQPFYSLAGTLIELLEPNLSKTDQLAETRNLAERLAKGEVRLAEVIGRLQKDSHSKQKVLLVIDQFEELYTLCSDVNLQKAFIDDLLATVEASKAQPDGLAVIMITLRADFMGQALAHRPFADALQEASLMLGPMNRQELQMAIEKPAEMQGAAFEPGLVARILDDVGEKPGNLPLLEFTLTQLWECQTDGWLTHADYESIGCVEGALAFYADQVYAELDESEQELARQAFVQLVKPGEGTEDTRRIATRDELGVESWKLIQRMADKRLVVAGRDAQGNETAEVVHEALIQKWGKLQEWMNSDRAFRLWQERLRTNIRQWQESHQDAGALLAGAPLAVAEDWQVQRSAELNPAEKDYIQASQALQNRQQKERRRRRQWIFATMGIGLVVAILLAAFALYQRQVSLHQASIGLASQAMQELEGESPERSVLLALEALQKYPYTWQAEAALWQIVNQYRLQSELIGHVDTVNDVTWSPDGTRMASGSNDGTLRIWDAKTHSQLLQISAHPASSVYTAGVSKVAWSLDGTRIATAGTEGKVKVWDAVTGEQLAEFSGHSVRVWGVAWSPDGTLVASSSADGVVIVWDAATGEGKYTLSGHSGAVKSVAWSPDGQSIATAGDDKTARIWDAASGEQKLILAGHTNGVWSVDWSPDGTRLATASEDGRVIVWEAASGRELSDFRPSSPIWKAAWSPDGFQLATTSASGLAQVWDVSTSQEVFSLQGKTVVQFTIAWSPDGKQLATTGGPGFSVRIWDASLKNVTLKGEMAQETTNADVPLGINYISWSPDSRRIATVDTPFGPVTIWDAQSGEALLTIQTGNAPDVYVQDVFWSPDGSQIVVTSWDQLAKIFDTISGEKLLTFTGHVGEPPIRFAQSTVLAGGGWSPDGSRIVTMGSLVRIWDAHSGKELVNFEPTRDAFLMPRWSPDGTRIATCSMPEVLQIWDATTGKSIIGGFTWNTADVAIGDPMTFCMGSEWSPDGQRILTDQYAGGGTASIWDAKTGKKILTYNQISGPITMPTWSPNGLRIATGTDSGIVKIWDSRSGATLFSLSMPVAANSLLYNLAWSPDGTHLISNSATTASTEIYRVWQSTQDLIDYANQCCVFRELSAAERDQFGLP